jgi:hypothetical protein
MTRNALAADAGCGKITALQQHHLLFGGLGMPIIRRMLEGKNFTPEAVAVLVEAFNEIVDELYLRSPAEREKAARILIELTLTRAILDAEELRDDAIGLMRDERAEVHGRDLDHPEGPRGDQSNSVRIG